MLSTDRPVSPNNFGYRVTQPSFYFMDDWKVTQRLTLNLGLRWEMNFGYNEVAGRMSVVDLTKPNPGAGNRPGALVFADELGVRGFHDKYLKMISPRLGFAYKVTEKMVVRGGYGINANPFITSGFDTPGNLGYNGQIVVNRTTNPTQFPQDPVFYLHQPYPSLSSPLPNRSPTLANLRASVTSRRTRTAPATRRTTASAFSTNCRRVSCSKSATSATKARGSKPTGSTT